MPWQLKFLRSTAFALLPGGSWLRAIKRKLIPYAVQLDPETLENAFEMIAMLEGVGLHPRGRVMLEVGSGWWPTIPLLMRLAGARRIYLVDTQRLLDVQLLRGIAGKVRERADTIADRLGADRAHVRATLECPADAQLGDLLEHFGFVYLAPADATALTLEDGSIDVAISRAVLEHIPAATLARIFAELRRVLNKDGGMCHIVDNSDHWSHADARLSRINFLRYSESRWRWFAINPLDYQNRLRHSDYLHLAQRAGFRIVEDRSVPDARALDELMQLRIDRAFATYGADDLAILTSRFVARAETSAPRGAAVHAVSS
jgi:SAM-dependent methyltransferase